MRRTIRSLWLLPLIAVLAQCGGGDSESGGGSTTGRTPFFGEWSLIATINVIVGGTQTIITDTSKVFVRPDGKVVVLDTDVECSLDIGVTGNLMTYRTDCLFAVTTEELSTSCTLTIVTRALISGAPGSAKLSSSFGPKTEACRGVAASYTGNLVGTQDFPDDETDTGNGTDNGADEGDTT